MALVLPTPVQAAAQTPVNTFSPTSTPLANAVNGYTYTYDPVNAVWTSAAGGGGGGTVTGVTATLPLASTGGATPDISATLATSAQAAAGTSNVVLMTPEFAVPKDAAGMTGAALLPTGTNLQRPGTPVAGMTRFNTDYTPDSLEVYNGTSWGQLAYAPSLGTLTDLIPTNGSTLPAAGAYENIIINAGVTVNVPSNCSLTARTSIQINGTINASYVGNWGGKSSGANSDESKSIVQGQGLGSGLGINNYGFSASFMGSGGFAASVSAGSSSSASSGNGGRSGGSIILISQGPITVGASAIIQAAGESGGTGSSFGTNFSWGGSGGGSGGLIILQSSTSLTLVAGSQLFVNGGNGSNASTSGTQTTAGGGGGGGGGYIALNSPSTSDSSTKNLTGGSGGATVIDGSGIGGGTGAGFGGSGGAGSISGANGAAGSAGQVILNAYI